MGRGGGDATIPAMPSVCAHAMVLAPFSLVCPSSLPATTLAALLGTGEHGLKSGNGGTSATAGPGGLWRSSTSSTSLAVHQLDSLLSSKSTWSTWRWQPCIFSTADAAPPAIERR